MPIKRIQQTVPLRILDWQRCVGLFLEGFSLLCELHGAQVPEGRVEPLVVVPPHVPVDVRAWLLHVRVDVPVDELLPDEPVGGFDHRVVVWVAGCFASMFVRQVRQCLSVVWADGFPRCRHRFPVM